MSINTLEQYPTSFSTMDTRIRNDPKLVRKAFSLDPENLQYASSTLRSKRGFMMSLIGLGERWGEPSSILKYAAPCLRRDPIMVLSALKHNPRDIQYVISPEILNNPEIMIHGIDPKTGFGINYVSIALRNSISFAKTLLELGVCSDFLQSMSRRIRNDPEIVRLAISTDGYWFWKPPVGYQNKPSYISLLRAQDTYWKGWTRTNLKV